MSSFLTNNALDLPESATPPAAPDAGRRKLYPGEDGQWYSVGSDGEAVAVGGGAIMPRRYIALVTQNNEDAPTDIVILNELSGVPVWTRFDAGAYRLTLNGAFPPTRTTYRIPSGFVNGADQMLFTVANVHDDYIELYTFDVDANPVDWLLPNLVVEIHVYPETIE